jgi:hypothetical protein
MLDPDIPPEAEEEAEGAVGVALTVADPDGTASNMAESIPLPWTIAIEPP